MEPKSDGASARPLPRLFISYAHRASGHDQVARDLVAGLRARGFTCVFDQDVQPSPPQGWAVWMHAELQAAERVLILWSSEYRNALKRAKGGSHFELTAILKMAYVERGLDHFVPCVARSSERETIDFLWRDHASFVVPHEVPQLSAHLRGAAGQQRVTRKVTSGQRGKTVSATPARGEVPLRFVFSFAKDARAVESGSRLDVLEGLCRRSAISRPAAGRASLFLRELVEDLPSHQRARSLEILQSKGGIHLRRYPGHGRQSPLGDPVREAEVHEFSWRLRPGEPPSVTGHLLISGSKGKLLLGRLDAPALIHVELRDLPTTHAPDRTRNEAKHVTGC